MFVGQSRGAMSGDEVSRWLRPATIAEQFLYQLQEVAGLLGSTYGMTLRTTHPLKDEQVQQALVHLFR